MEIDGRRYELKRPPPEDRTVDQLWNHFLIERAIAIRIKSSPPSARMDIYAGMYGELFAQVPDHPRLTRRASDEMTAAANRSRLGLLKPWIRPDAVAAEFACGDARFSMEELAPRVRKVYGIDISDQRDPSATTPPNFQMITYDGYVLNGIPQASVDFVFSDQFLEHLHPDEVKNHLQIVRKILKPRGQYIIRTPYALTGPHDISAYFSDEPEGFHLHEWLFSEMAQSLIDAGFSDVVGYWNKRNSCIPVPTPVLRGLESLMHGMPRASARKLSRYLLPTLVCAARK